MAKISQKKKNKINEQIIHYLFSVAPDSRFTSDIAMEIARDEEFVKSLLIELKEKNLIHEIGKSPKGENYSKRRRWRLSDTSYQAYLKLQRTNKNNVF